MEPSVTTYDNAPPPADWHPEPRVCTIFDLVTRAKAMQPLEMPDCELGEN